MASHLLLHVPPGGKDPLAPDAIHPVHNTVQDPHPHVGHTNLIRVREAERHPDVHFVLIFYDLSVFPAYVTGRLLHLPQDPLQLLCHVCSLNLSFSFALC